MIKEFGGDYFQWIRGFYYVYKTGSVSEAARELGRRQPTVSKQIKNLEEHYGVILFERSNRKMVVTPDGQKMIEHAISVCESVKEISDKFKEKTKKICGNINIASTHGLIVYYLSQYITGFIKKNPQVSIELTGSAMVDVCKEHLDSGKADFAVIYMEKAWSEYDTHHIFTTNFSLISGEENLFGIKKGMSLPEIARLPFLGYPPESNMKGMLERRFLQEGCELSNILILNHFAALKTFIKQNLGVSIILDYALTEYDKKQMHIISLREYFDDICVCLVTRKRKYLSPAAKAFISDLSLLGRVPG